MAIRKSTLKHGLLLGVALAAGSAALPASAAYLAPWGPPLAPAPTGGGVSGEPHTDITNVYFYSGNTDFYFRMDLAGPVNDVNNSWIYMIYIDKDNNTATGRQPGEDSPYYPLPAVGSYYGIDATLAVHYALGAVPAGATHLHPYINTPPYVSTIMLPSIGGVYQGTENGYTTVEFSLPKAALGAYGPEMRFYAAVHSNSPNTTPDISAGYLVSTAALIPEIDALAGTGALSFLGVSLALAAERRRKAGASA
jgi:hypothetical protein